MLALGKCAPEEQLPWVGFRIREDHTLHLRGGPTRGPRGNTALKRSRRGGSLVIRTLPAIKTNTGDGWKVKGEQTIEL